MRIFYSFFIRCYGLLISIASLVNTKAKLWIEGRKNIFRNLEKSILNNKPIFWMHCSSLGEFEQGRPLIEKIKKEQPQYFILLTFFSPSGYETCKHYEHANAVFYLPLDTSQNAKQFLNIVKPKIVCFVKYEYWFNFINEIHQRNILLYFVSVILRPNQHFFSWYGKWSLKQLKKVNHFFVQDKQTEQLLLTNKIKQVSVTGDTRFDRVMELTQNRKKIELAEIFSQNATVLVAGSTWAKDDDVLVAALKNSTTLKVIVAPHELSADSLNISEKKYSRLGKVIRYSKSTDTELKTARILLIDNIGILSSLYAYAYISYVGGGFGKGIHNILEAAVYGKPVFFGPNYKKFNEARDLIQLGGAISIGNTNDLEKKINELLTDKELYQRKTQVCRNYVQKQEGATQKIIDFIFNK